MQEMQLKLPLYSNRTELRAELSLPNTEENYGEFIREKIIWEKRDIFNVACIKWIEEKNRFTNLEELNAGYFHPGSLEGWEWGMRKNEEF